MAEAESFYRQILDESSDPIFSFFPDGTYRYVNHAFATGEDRVIEVKVAVGGQASLVDPS